MDAFQSYSRRRVVSPVRIAIDEGSRWHCRARSDDHTVIDRISSSSCWAEPATPSHQMGNIIAAALPLKAPIGQIQNNCDPNSHTRRRIPRRLHIVCLIPAVQFRLTMGSRMRLDRAARYRSWQYRGRSGSWASSSRACLRTFHMPTPVDSRARSRDCL